MRFSFATILPVVVLLTDYAQSMPVPKRKAQIQVLEYNIESAHTKFSVPASPWFKSAPTSEDDALVFEVQLNSSDPLTTELVLNGQRLDVPWSKDHSIPPGTLQPSPTTVRDLHGRPHVVALSFHGDIAVFGKDGTQQQTITFHAADLDGHYADVDFTLVLEPAKPLRLKRLLSHYSNTDSVDFARFQQSFVIDPQMEHREDADSKKHVDFDLAEDIEELSLLEAQVEALNLQISSKKQAIAYHLRENRNHATLNHLLEECDGLVCSARVIAQRVCDKIYTAIGPSSGPPALDSQQLQHLITFADGDGKPKQTSRNCTRSALASKLSTATAKHTDGSQTANLPIFMTKNSSSPAQPQLPDLLDVPNPLLRVLQILASVLGLAILVRCIRRQCMSIRSRVERAADREERRNARAYRRAARRAEFSRRWNDLGNALSCFKSRPEPRIEDYEEKRALILQDAFLEQIEDLDQAAKVEIMEAEIRELRHAHEIVASLVRVDEHRFDLAPPIRDPPPSMVPLPYEGPAEGRSRASTNTLPSYCSEPPPDYSSQPEMVMNCHHSVASGFRHYTPSTSSGETGSQVAPSTSSGAAKTRYTPTSSVVDVSSRASEDTL